MEENLSGRSNALASVALFLVPLTGVAKLVSPRGRSKSTGRRRGQHRTNFLVNVVLLTGASPDAIVAGRRAPDRAIWVGRSGSWGRHHDPALSRRSTSAGRALLAPARRRAVLDLAVGGDAPDFLATAPVARSAIECDKIAAIGQPIVLILALPLAVLGFASPWAGLCALLFGAGAIGFVSFGQSLATSAVPSRSGAAPVIRSRSFSAPLSLGVDSVGGCDGDR